MKLTITREKFTLYAWLSVAFVVLNLFTNLASYPGTALQRTINTIWLIFYLCFLNYLLLEITLPYIRLSWQRILSGILLLFLYMMLYSYGAYGWRHFGIQLHIYTALILKPTFNKELEYMMGFSMSSVFFFAIIRHVYNYIKLKQATKNLLIEKQQAELNYLKSQTNPHFLFNTLNNIYSLARDKSDLAPESILRLSKILRFMLYETSGAYIAIEQELKIINDYIALEKLRYDDSLHVNFNYDIEDMKQALPPLLLMPLVENAFKHGVSETRSQPFVDIHLSVKGKQLLFQVRNSVEAFAEEKNIKENIGLANLRRQLELLYKDFNLSVQKGESAFTAILKINLSSHV
jgi:two-component system LytT family sensor kinase